MSDTVNTNQARLIFGVQMRWAIICALLLVAGAVGVLHAAIGYGLFLVASLLLVSGTCFLAIFMLTHLFSTEYLNRAYRGAFWLGGWGYLLALAAFSGYYLNQAVAGNIEWRYIAFGPAALVALVVFDTSIWRIIVKRNLPSVHRFGELWKREALDQRALRHTLVNEVVLHRTLFSISPFRWVRHQLIFWGFGMMFLTELLAVGFREIIPAFGFISPWDQPGHPIRLAFDFSFELTGVMILAGCVLALAFRLRVQGSDLQRYTDTPSALFLLVVVATGFVTEAMRMSLSGDATGENVSFVGLGISRILPVSSSWYDPLWTLHALLACGFIAYIPLKRMIHSCATPIGRLVNSQTRLLSAKKTRTLSGLFRRKGHD